MTSQQEKHLLKMAEQIAANLSAGVDAETAAERTADHLRRFWTPQMRSQLAACAEEGAVEPGPTVVRALSLLSAQQTA